MFIKICYYKKNNNNCKFLILVFAIITIAILITISNFLNLFCKNITKYLLKPRRIILKITLI